MTDGRGNILHNGLMAHLDQPNGAEGDNIHYDAYISDKTIDFLNHTVLHFIGPDRAPVEITDVQQCLDIAETIASTGLPHYAQARIPVKSDLNIREWEKELSDYPDKMLIEYLKFWFPLSLTTPEQLHNTQVTNHHSVIQYSSAVQEYLSKEAFRPSNSAAHALHFRTFVAFLLFIKFFVVISIHNLLIFGEYLHSNNSSYKVIKHYFSSISTCGL